MKSINFLLLFFLLYQNLQCIADISKKEQQTLNNNFIKAAKNNDLYNVQLYLKQGAQINSRNEIGQRYSALHEASFKGNLDIVKFLVQNHAIIDIEDDLKRTPLYFAVQNLKTDVVDFLIKNGARIIKSNSLIMICLKIESTSLLNKDKTNALKIFEILLNANATRSLYNSFDLSKFNEFIQRNEKIRTTYYKYLKNKAICEFSNRDITTQKDINEHLDYAVTRYPNALEAPNCYEKFYHRFDWLKDYFELIEFYYECGAQIDESYVIHRIASKYSFPIDISKFLIEKSMNIDIEDEYNKTALFYAIDRLNIKIIKLLINKGANVNKILNISENFEIYKNYFQLLFSNSDRIEEKIEVLKLLLQAGIDINLPLNEQGLTLLTYPNETIATVLKNHLAEIKKNTPSKLDEVLPNIPKELQKLICQYAID